MAASFIPPALRRRVRRRAANICEYRRYPQVACYATFECDHVVPLIAGGGVSVNNLAWACPTCNSAKRDRTSAIDSASGQLVTLFNPRTDRWSDHFTWSSDGLRIHGRT